MFYLLKKIQEIVIIIKNRTLNRHRWVGINVPRRVGELS